MSIFGNMSNTGIILLIAGFFAAIGIILLLFTLLLRLLEVTDAATEALNSYDPAHDSLKDVFKKKEQEEMDDSKEPEGPDIPAEKPDDTTANKEAFAQIIEVDYENKEEE